MCFNEFLEKSKNQPLLKQTFSTAFRDRIFPGLSKLKHFRFDMAQLNEIINELTMQMERLSLGPESTTDSCQPRTRRQALMARNVNVQVVEHASTTQRKFLEHQTLRQAIGNENATMEFPPVAVARRSKRVRTRKLHFDELEDVVNEIKRKPAQVLEESIRNATVEVRGTFAKSLGHGGENRENKLYELTTHEKKHLANCTKAITKPPRVKGYERKFKGLKKVRFLNEVQVFLVAGFDETRSCTEWHKNLTREGLMSAQMWRQELDQQEQKEREMNR